MGKVKGRTGQNMGEKRSIHFPERELGRSRCLTNKDGIGAVRVSCDKTGGRGCWVLEYEWVWAGDA